MLRNRTLLLVLVLAALTSGTAAQTRAPRATSGAEYVAQIQPLLRLQASAFREVVDRYAADRAAMMRRFDAAWSPTRRERLREFYGGWRTALHGAEFNSLPQPAKVDYVLLDTQLQYELRLLEREQRVLTETTALVPFLDPIFELHDARRNHEPVDGRKAAATLKALLDRIEETRKAVEAGVSDKPAPTTASLGAAAPTAAPIKTTKIVAFRAAEIASSARRTLEEWHKYRVGYDPLFSWWTSDPYAKTDKALGEYIKTLREKVVGIKEGEDEPIIGDPIGATGLREDLDHELIPYTPEELIEIANREFKVLEAEMLKASKEMGFGDNWKGALEQVKNDHVEPGSQPEMIRDLAYEAIEYVTTHNLVTVPPLARDIWRMTMMTPERQKVAPFFLGGEVIQVSFPTDTMEHDDKLMSLRGNNRWFSRATVHHELIPGHHLQGFMSQRYATYRAVFATPFWMEGWALYWEMLLWDRGFFHTSPESRVGAMFWRMHRAARIIFSLNFHLGKMTPQEAIDFLVDRVGHERANAEAEVRRSFIGTYSPLYQAAYMLGGLQFRTLHRELVESKKMTDQQFHDTVLQNGRIPVEMVRALLTNQPLTRDYKPNWRF